MYRTLSIIALLFIVVGLIGAFTTGKQYLESEIISGEERFAANEVQSISIESDISDIHLQPSDDENVYVVWDGKVRSTVGSDIEIALKNGKLTVNLKGNGFFSFFHFPLNTYTVQVFIPQDTLENVSIHNNVGTVNVEDVKLKRVTIKTDVSDIHMKNVSTESSQLSSSVGGISILNSSGAFDIDSDIGDIDIVAPEITGDIYAKTNVGDITLQVNSSQREASIFGTSDLGRVNILNRMETKHLVDGATLMIDLKTDLGDITVSDI